MMLTDTHCHVQMDSYESDREQVLHRAHSSGVQRIIAIGTDLESSEQAVSLAEEKSWVFATVGVHPHDVKHLDSGIFNRLATLTQNAKVVAIGETGLDYYYNHSPSDVQVKWFREHIRLARASNLPLVIHSRDANEKTIMVLEEEKAQEVGGVFHCFTGDTSMASKGLAMGFYLSFSGIVTFNKAKDIQEIASTVPIEKLLLETDCPYLTPVPHRGKRNEPLFVKWIAEKIAELRGTSTEEIAQVTSENAARLFKFKK